MKKAVWLFVVITLGLFTKIYAQNIFVSNESGNTIEEFNTNGVGTVFASTGFDAPTGLAFDSAGNLYAGNYNSNNILKFNSSGGVLSSNGTVFASGILNPRGLAFNAAGTLFAVSDSSSILTIAGGTGTLFATTGETPIGGAFDSSGNLYVTVQNDPGSGNEVIDKITTNGSVSVFANSGLDYPTFLAFNKSGNLFVANYDNNTIEEFNTNGVGTVFASTGVSGPEGLAFDNNGNLYVVNDNNTNGNYTIEEFNTNGVGRVFASTGLNGPLCIAIQVPEPSTWTLLAVGLIALLPLKRRS